MAQEKCDHYQYLIATHSDIGAAYLFVYEFKLIFGQKLLLNTICNIYEMLGDARLTHQAARPGRKGQSNNEQI